MANFTAKDVQALREQTNVGMMDCKKALTESDGDFEKAIEYLREKGLAAAAKKAGRVAAEGMVGTVVCPNTGVGAIVEVNSETDFVAKNEDFQKFVGTVANVVVAENPADMAALMACKYPESELTVEEMLREKVLTIGENLQIRRFERYDNSTLNVAYTHMGGVIGALVALEVSDNLKASAEMIAVGKDIGMQIAAMNPSYRDKSEVPAEVLENEKKIMLAQMAEDPKMQGKPEQVMMKIVEGKVGKYYSENCLLQQAFVKDDKNSVEEFASSVAKGLGGTVTVTKYARFEKGEGIEKKEDDFAAEVAKMSK